MQNVSFRSEQQKLGNMSQKNGKLSSLYKSFPAFRLLTEHKKPHINWCRLKSKRYITDKRCVSMEPVVESICSDNCVMPPKGRNGHPPPPSKRVSGIKSGWRPLRVYFKCFVYSSHENNESPINFLGYTNQALKNKGKLGKYVGNIYSEVEEDKDFTLMYYTL